MKIRTSKKSFRHEEVYGVGYCKLQYLLRSEEPIAYSAGIYGWSCDYYKIGDIYISTGYSPIGKKADYKIVEHFNKLAEKTYDSSISWEEGKRRRSMLLKRFAKKIAQVKE